MSRMPVDLKESGGVRLVSSQQAFFKQGLAMISGATAGVISRTAVAPIERVIIMQQTRISYVGSGVVSMIAEMWKKEGVVALFKGNKANCLRIAPF